MLVYPCTRGYLGQAGVLHRRQTPDMRVSVLLYDEGVRKEVVLFPVVDRDLDSGEGNMAVDQGQELLGPGTGAQNGRPPDILSTEMVGHCNTVMAHFQTSHRTAVLDCYSQLYSQALEAFIFMNLVTSNYNFQ